MFKPNKKFDANGFSRVDTPLFDGMLVQPQVQDVEDAAEDEDDDNVVYAEPIPPSPTPATPSPSPAQEHIPKLQIWNKIRLLKPSRSQSSSKGSRGGCIQTGGGVAKLDADEDITLEEVDAEVTMDPDVQERMAESQVKVKRKEKKDNTVMRYQALKRKTVTEAQARKNMMIYLKNMAGFKMDFFKGMTYTDIRPIYKKHYNLNQAFLERVEEEVTGQKEEGKELKTHLHIVPNDDDDVYTKATPLALKVPVVDYQIHHEHDKPYYKIIRADGTHQLFLSFITLLKNFDREDL
nr:hypothetical protein [Tanacetum cinerariifolium]GEX65490.1 hypothetical protein [Tanacetum cinerariifolium]